MNLKFNRNNILIFLQFFYTLKTDFCCELKQSGATKYSESDIFVTFYSDIPEKRRQKVYSFSFNSYVKDSFFFSFQIFETILLLLK